MGNMGSYYSIPKAIVYLRKGDFISSLPLTSTACSSGIFTGLDRSSAHPQQEVRLSTTAAVGSGQISKLRMSGHVSGFRLLETNMR